MEVLGWLVVVAAVVVVALRQVCRLALAYHALTAAIALWPEHSYSCLAGCYARPLTLTGVSCKSEAASMLTCTSAGGSVVLSVAPLLGAHAHVDARRAKWLHVHVRPHARGLLKCVRVSMCIAQSHIARDCLSLELRVSAHIKGSA